MNYACATCILYLSIHRSTFQKLSAARQLRLSKLSSLSSVLFLQLPFFVLHSPPPRWTSASISNAHVKCRQFLLPHLLQRTYNWPLSATVFKSSATPPFKTCERICNHDFRNLHIQSYIYIHMSHIYILYTYISIYIYTHTYTWTNIICWNFPRSERWARSLLQRPGPSLRKIQRLGVGLFQGHPAIET